MVLGRLQTQHRDTCLAATRSPFSTFDTQPLSFHILMNSVSVNPFGAHTSKKSHIYIKTRGFKPFRDTYLQTVISQSLLNHILTKNRGWGVGGTLVQDPPQVTGHERFRRVPTPVGTNHESPVYPEARCTGRRVTTATGETRFPPRTSNPIGKRVPGKRGWL